MKYEEVLQEHLPINPNPPDYPTCKEYLDFRLEVINKLQIPFIYVHSHKMVYSKLYKILLKNKDIYTKIILLISGFYQLRVMQRLLYKYHFSKEYKNGAWTLKQL